MNTRLISAVLVAALGCAVVYAQSSKFSSRLEVSRKKESKENLARSAIACLYPDYRKSICCDCRFG